MDYHEWRHNKLNLEFGSSPPRALPQLSQEVINFNQSISEADEAHQRRHDLYHGITKPSDWGLG
jgi:hypothetical protein